MNEPKPKPEQWMIKAAQRCCEHVTPKRGTFQSLVRDQMALYIAEEYAEHRKGSTS